MKLEKEIGKKSKILSWKYDWIKEHICENKQCKDSVEE